MNDSRPPRQNIIALLVAFTGALTLSSTLFALLHLHRVKIVISDAHVTVIAGISLIYLAALLRRGKFNAWAVSLAIYSYLIIRNFEHFVVDERHSERLLPAILNLGVPVVTLALLFVFREHFRVRSEIRSFTLAVRRALIILVVAFLYGVVGFQLFDEHDFHQEIRPVTAVHYTLDQSGFTTSNQPVAYTKRARFFVDSLAAVSITSVVYVGLSFFAPIRFRLSPRSQDYQLAAGIIGRHAASSEDFFKLWPRDKAFFFDKTQTSLISYKVARGVSLSVGDPVGVDSRLKPLLSGYLDYCRTNDWPAAFIHTEDRLRSLYEEFGFSLQKIGEEALVDTRHFSNSVSRNKYFRHINNKFTKAGFSFEMLPPPHSSAVIAQLKHISDDWLSRPGRAERGFMMGYFNESYIQSCRLAVVRGPGGEIAAFANQIASPKPDEANFDFLRHVSGAPGNINDFLMLNFIHQLSQDGCKTLNMGLSPLSGLGPSEIDDRSALDGLLNFFYSNAGKFYSFKGLRRFKDKYEPRWESRYIVYKGGLAGLSRTMNALLKAMSR